MACKDRPQTKKEEEVKKKVIAKKNKSMEAFNYPSLGKVVYATSQKEADEYVKNYL